MKYDFDRRIDRVNSKSVKWDREVLRELYGEPDLLPLWVADMDFRVAEPIINAMREEVSHGIFGYSKRPDSYYDAIIRWYRERFGWAVSKDWIVYNPGVVSALNFMLEAFCSKGDGVIIQEPVYFPFKSCILINGLKPVVNQLIDNSGCFDMDLEDLEEKARDPRNKALVLCSPHNPAGRVWSRQTLLKVGEICKKHDVLVFSDEVHHDLVYKKGHHCIYASISRELEQNCIIATAPSKTFNVVGLQTSHIVIPNIEIRDAFLKSAERKHISGQSPISMAAVEAAYAHGDQWLSELIEYLEKNITVIDNFLYADLPLSRWKKPEATYLAWIDISAYRPDFERIAKESGIAVINGSKFGAGGENYIRINFACPSQLLKEGLNRLCRIIK